MWVCPKPIHVFRSGIVTLVTQDIVYKVLFSQSSELRVSAYTIGCKLFCTGSLKNIVASALNRGFL